MKTFKSLIKFSLILSVISLVTYTMIVIEESIMGNDCGFISVFVFLLSNFLSILMVLLSIFISFRNKLYLLSLTNLFALPCVSYPWITDSMNAIFEITLLSMLIVINLINIYLFKHRYENTIY